MTTESIVSIGTMEKISSIIRALVKFGKSQSKPEDGVKNGFFTVSVFNTMHLISFFFFSKHQLGKDIIDLGLIKEL